MLAVTRSKDVLAWPVSEVKAAKFRDPREVDVEILRVTDRFIVLDGVLHYVLLGGQGTMPLPDDHMVVYEPDEKRILSFSPEAFADKYIVC